MRTKRCIPLLAAAILTLAPAAAAADAPLRVLTTFLPMHVFTMNVTAGITGISVDMMLPSSLGCPHDYALTASDMRKIAGADILIANGMGMENFLDTVARKANPQLLVIETTSSVSPLLTTEKENHKAHAHEDKNPHTWVSPKNAIIQVRAIEKALGDASPENRGKLHANANAYIKRLESLDRKYREASARFRNRNIVTSHNAFDYLAQEYGLTIAGRIEDVPGQEPSAGEIRALLQTIREKKVPAIFAEPQNTKRIIDIIAREAGIPVFPLDPVVTGQAAPTSYEDAMLLNLKTLTESLSYP
ncbi:MAG: metal ABC transporter substrate-binding protein [Syntrophorhabdaceae bacterium]|nr:metal ABC transporter substrate-binding protein [Syntrophorhabdaceae bacterium]